MWLQLLKLHGDFTRLGEPELVAGHVQYRRVMLREARHALLVLTLIIAPGCPRFGSKHSWSHSSSWVPAWR